MRQIKRMSDDQMFEFDTLNAAIRELTYNGARLIEKSNKKRFTYEASKSILEKAGYTVIASDAKRATPVERVGVEVVKATSPTEGAKVIEQFAKVLSEMAGGASEEKIAAIVDSKLAPFGNEMRADVAEALNTMKSELLEEIKPVTKEVIVRRADDVKVNVGSQHEMFEDLLIVINQRLNALMVGPAGSGKTTAAEKVAEALGLKYYSISVGMQTSKSEFFGYMDAHGKYSRTLFREAFEFGGVFLLDELDAGNANVIVAINQALANGQCGFPDGMIKKHDDFVIVASANTFGHGASREYIGRNPLDAATLDRFQTIEWNYDLRLEEALCGNAEWLKVIRQIRKNAADFKVRTVVSPRASINGAKLLKAGMTVEKVLNMTVLKGIGKTETETLLKNVNLKGVRV